jgi:hypothetical protein
MQAMEQNFIYIITFLYSIGGIITFAGFFPTMADLWNGKPSANIYTYIIWALTTFFTALYAIFVLQDLVFSVVISLQLAACLIVLALSLRLKINTKKL